MNTREHHAFAAAAHRPVVKGFFDEATHTVSYVVSDPASGRCAVVDPVLDFDPASGRTATHSADRLIEYIREYRLKADWILETHVHADHLTAAPHVRSKVGGRVAIGRHIARVQETFSALFNVEPQFAADGSQFGKLFEDGEAFSVGTIEARAMHVPGHTPACMAYLVGGACFVGDTLFMPDYGTARCDFPGGDARQLYRSIRRLLSLPPETRLFVCHDYKAPGREDYRWETTVDEQRRNNIHVHDGAGEDDFVKMRTERDAALEMPALILPSVQVNMRAGVLPPPETNGTRYLKIPLDVF